MRPEFEHDWRRARGLENSGDPAAAWDIYQSLIRADPERLYVRLRLSALEQSFGHYRASREHALRAAETVRRGRWADLASVAMRLLAFGETGAMRALVMEADWANPEVLRSSAVLAQYLWLSDHVEDALRLGDFARTRMADNPMLGYSRASALRSCGRMAEATEEYERCLRLHPDFALAHWSLAYHAPSDRPGARIDRIRRTQQRLPQGSADHAYLHYALFKEFDDAGDIAEAWSHLQAGADCKRRATPYSSEREQRGYDALERHFAGHSIREGGPVPGDPGHVPLFIVGLPRSGTTLLERIVGNHPGVCAGGELTDFHHALAFDADLFFANVADASTLERLRGLDLSRVGRRYLERTAAKAGASRFLIDKNPMNLTNVGFIARALPQARVLCLRRNGMDACFSNLKELFSNDAYGYSYTLPELAEHYRRFTRLVALWQQVLPDRFLVVDFEDLVGDPVDTAARVTRFCGLEFDASSVDITRNLAPVTTASSSQIREPINTRGVGAWRRYAEYLQPLRERLGDLAPPA